MSGLIGGTIITVTHLMRLTSDDSAPVKVDFESEEEIKAKWHGFGDEWCDSGLMGP